MATQVAGQRRRERRLFVTGRGGRRFILSVRRTDPYELQVVGTKTHGSGRLVDVLEDARHAIAKAEGREVVGV